MRTYLVVIERGKNNYCAYVPDLPGCVASGDTLEETKQRIHEAIDLHICGMIEDGDPIPEATTVSDVVTTAIL